MVNFSLKIGFGWKMVDLLIVFIIIRNVPLKDTILY